MAASSSAQRSVCRNISLAAADVELLVVRGPNGAGKSSLLGDLAGAVEGAGEIRVAFTAVSHSQRTRPNLRPILLLHPLFWQVEARRQLRR